MRAMTPAEKEVAKKAKRAAYYAANREKLRAYQAAYLAANKEKLAARRKRSAWSARRRRRSSGATAANKAGHYRAWRDACRCQCSRMMRVRAASENPLEKSNFPGHCPRAACDGKFLRSNDHFYLHEHRVGERRLHVIYECSVHNHANSRHSQPRFISWRFFHRCDFSFYCDWRRRQFLLHFWDEDIRKHFWSRGRLLACRSKWPRFDRWAEERSILYMGHAHIHRANNRLGKLPAMAASARFGHDGWRHFVV